MEISKHLSIVVPTYNRAELLDYCLGDNIPLLRDHNIQLFIFDNASTDATEDIVRNRKKEYPLIEYCRNEKNIGPDENFERALKHPDTEYIWLMGDSYRIPPGGIAYLIDLISSKKQVYDLFLFNIDSEVKNIGSNDYTDHNNLLLDLFWLMTCMSCLVYSSKMIASANFVRYRNTNFIQTGIIFEYIADKKFNIHWEANLSVKRWAEGNIIRKESWQSRLLEVWLRDRANFILSLPPIYALDAKLKCIMGNGPHDGISAKMLARLRKDGVFTADQYEKYSYIFPLATRCPKFIVAIISKLPRSVAHVLYFLLKI